MAAFMSGSSRISAGIWLANRGGRRGVAAIIHQPELSFSKHSDRTRYLSEEHCCHLPPCRQPLLLVCQVLLPFSALRISSSDFVARATWMVHRPVAGAL